MRELLLAVDIGGTDRELAVWFDERATVGQLAHRLAASSNQHAIERATLERRSRRPGLLPRDEPLSRADLRSGDAVRVALDVGVTERQRQDLVGRVRVQSPGQPARSVVVYGGESVIGRSDRCEIPIDDELASRRHAKLVATDVIEVVDLGSTNGTAVNDTTIVAPRRLRSGDQIRVGDTVLTVEQAEASATVADATGNTVEFNRPPRIVSPYEGIEVELPAPPDPPPKQRLPMISALVPVIMGIALWLLTQSIFSVLFLALSPLMMLGSWWEGRRSGRADLAERLAAHRTDVDAAITRLDEAREQEIEQRFTAAPAVGELDAHVRDLSPRLWERQPGDEDFLTLRIGLAPLPSRTTITLAQGGARDLRAELAEIPDRYRSLPPVPVTLPVSEVGNLGVAGPSPYADHVARAVVAQACALHSPSELVVAALLTEASSSGWDWLKWVPHTRSPLSPLGEDHAATTIDDHLDVVATLNQLVADRERDHDERDPEPPSPRVLVVIDDRLPLERARLTGILERGPAVGIHSVWISGTARRLPKPCRGIVDIAPTGASATVGYVTRNEQVSDVTLDLLDPDAATSLARDLSPVVDVSTDRSRDAGIPRQVAMVELLGGAALLDDAAQVLERWREAEHHREGRGLRVPIGVGNSGPFAIDLRHDGPHGLVAGTTGAGKSELLQSLLVGLAVTHAPHRVTFLLVDYKGGAAFKDCVNLPHTVGLVTDLTPALVRRALTSLRAELHRRERLLNAANVKDLMAMEAQGHPDTPPSLLIVVDEFAALAKEVPEFVDGVVDVAQRGRSLGLHLLLATQRPQGVITDNIRANTNLKVALRVATEDESADVIASPSAAQIDRSLSGRAVARLGPSDLIAFQTGYVGGHTEAADDTPEVEVADLDLTGRTPWTAPSSNPPQRGAATDLERLVMTVQRAHEETGRAAPRRPWLDPLHERYDLLRLPRDGHDTALPIGVHDEPDRQWQRIATFEPDRDGSVLIYGAGGSGKTVTLRTLAASAALTDRTHPVEIHGIDAAGRGLSLLEPLPQVGAIVAVDDHDRLTRLIQDLGELVADRIDALGRYRASSLTELRSNGAAEFAHTPRVLLLIDGFENLQGTYENLDRGRWYDAILRLATDGRAAGVHLAMTGSRRTAFPTVLTSTVGRRFVLRLATLDEYAMLGADTGLVDGDEPAGRAIDGDGLTQLAMAGTRTDTAGQAEALRALGERLAAEGAHHAADVAVLPDSIPLSDRMGVGNGGGLVVGLDDRLAPFELPLDEHVLFAGPPRSGRSTAIATLAHAAVASGRAVTVVSGRRPVPHLPARVTEHVGTDAAVTALQAVPAGMLVLVDQVEILLDGPADAELERLLDRDGVTVVAACESATARRYSMTLSRLRRTRRSVLLQPDADLDVDLAGAPLPRTSRAYPTGRGLWCDGGQLRVVQFADPAA